MVVAAPLVLIAASGMSPGAGSRLARKGHYVESEWRVARGVARRGVALLIAAARAVVKSRSRPVGGQLLPR